MIIRPYERVRDSAQKGSARPPAGTEAFSALGVPAGRCRARVGLPVATYRAWGPIGSVLPSPLVETNPICHGQPRRTIAKAGGLDAATR